MKKIFDSFLGLIIFFACIALGYIIYYICINSQHYDVSWLEMLYWFSLSFLSAFIFYIFTDYLPSRYKRKIESNDVLDIISKIKDLNCQLLRDLGVNDVILKREDLNEKRIFQKLCEECKNKKFLDKPEPKFPYDKIKFEGSKDWVEYFTKFLELEKQYFKELETSTDLHPYVKRYLYFSSGFMTFRWMVENYNSYKESGTLDNELFPEELRFIGCQSLQIFYHIVDIYNLENEYKSTLNLI